MTLSPPAVGMLPRVNLRLVAMEPKDEKKALPAKNMGHRLEK